MDINKIRIKSYISSFLIVGIFIMAGCEPPPAIRYQVDFNIGQPPQMGIAEAYQDLKRLLGANVTNEGFSWTENGVQDSCNFDKIQSLNVATHDNVYYGVYVNSANLWGWNSQGDAQTFVDAVMAMKYYASKHLLADDDASFAEFQQKVKDWRVLAQKPSISDEVRRFRVLADDAVQNKQFDKAADYYEQGLAIEPMWSAGQFNAALIYAEIEFYPLAVMHMKRYLALNPDAKDAKVYQDKLYIWEEKAGEEGLTSGSSSARSAQPTSSLSSAGLAQQFLQNAGAK